MVSDFYKIHFVFADIDATASPIVDGGEMSISDVLGRYALADGLTIAAVPMRDDHYDENEQDEQSGEAELSINSDERNDGYDAYAQLDEPVLHDDEEPDVHGRHHHGLPPHAFLHENNIHMMVCVRTCALRVKRLRVQEADCPLRPMMHAPFARPLYRGDWRFAAPMMRPMVGYTGMRPPLRCASMGGYRPQPPYAMPPAAYAAMRGGGGHFNIRAQRMRPFYRY
jgi:hypothetical protein